MRTSSSITGHKLYCGSAMTGLSCLLPVDGVILGSAMAEHAHVASNMWCVLA